MRGRFGFTLMAVAMLALVACGSDDGGGNDDGGTDGGVNPDATWSFVQSQVLSGCGGAACHGADNLPQQLVLTTNAAYANLVNVPSEELPEMDYIEPGSPEYSYFYRKLANTQGAACAEYGRAESACGVRMPLSAPAVSADTLAAVEQWILDGAAEN